MAPNVRTARPRCRCATAAALGLLLAGCATAGVPPIEVNPNRPTFATPALTTQEGVAELEAGVQRSALRDGGDVFASPFLLKLGLVRHLELRVGGNGLLRQADPAAATGFGDTTLGAQWCYWPGGPLGFEEAVQLTWKFPTASAAKGLGSGESDATLMLLLSRDAGPFHADINGLLTRVGRPAALAGGSERQGAGTLSVTRNLGERWSLTGELYSIGRTSLGPLLMSNLWAVAYKARSSLVFDGAVDVGISHGAPRYTILAGVTTGLGRFRRLPSEGPPATP